LRSVLPIIFWLLLAVCHASPEEIDPPISQEELPSDSSKKQRASSIPEHTIQAIILVNSKAELLEVDSLQGLYGLKIKDVPIPGTKSALNAKLTPLYYNQKFTQKNVTQIKKAITEFYEENGLPFVLVSVPSQNITKGVLQLVVQESKIGKLEFVGNKWAPTKMVSKYLTLKEGDSIRQNALLKDLDFMNRNPFRRVSLIYSQGDTKNTTNLTFDVDARKPYRFYTGVDDTGVPTTGRGRVFAGFCWDQMFQLDHMLLFQYTTNYESSKFHAYTVQYTAYLPWEAVLNLFGGYSSVHAHLPYPDRSNHGQSGQASLRYHTPFAPNRSLIHEFIAGADWKITDNTVEYVDTVFPVFAQAINISQGVLGYVCKYQKEKTAVESGIEMFFSPGEILPGQSNADFESLRPGAKNTWVYFNGHLSYEKMFSSFTYQFYFKGQASTESLIPMVQLGIGGYGSVRGYDERQMSVDTGMFVSNELRAPGFSIFRSKQPHQDKMQFLIFFDVGGGADYNKIFSIKPHNYLMGAGPGVRYHFGQFLTARLDWGIKLHHQEGFTGGNSMFHFSVIGSY